MEKIVYKARTKDGVKLEITKDATHYRAYEGGKPHEPEHQVGHPFIKLENLLTYIHAELLPMASNEGDAQGAEPVSGGIPAPGRPEPEQLQPIGLPVPPAENAGVQGIDIEADGPTEGGVAVSTEQPEPEPEQLQPIGEPVPPGEEDRPVPSER